MNSSKLPFRDHRPVVVRHVLGDRRKSRRADLQHLLKDVQVELGQVRVDAVDQLRLVVEGQADLGEPHQGAREPEASLQRDPHHGLAARLALGPGTHRLDRRAVIGKQCRPHAQVIIHVGDDPLHVMLHRLDRGIRGGEPELLVGVQPEILGDVEDAFQFGGQALALPAGDRLVPPHGPLPSGKPIHGLEAHQRAEALAVIHAVLHGCDLGPPEYPVQPRASMIIAVGGVRRGGRIADAGWQRISWRHNGRERLRRSGGHVSVTAA